MTDHTSIPVYTAAAPQVPSGDELRARIPGWGVDLDPRDRPAYPREQREDTGAHWDLPERQAEEQPRERSIEHQMLPPVFGTSVPLRGLSGAIRRYSYERFSEARAAHWLLLLAGDRVDAVESRFTALARLHPDDPLTETGIGAEAEHGASRFNGTRADVRHQWLDPIVVAGPWVAGVGLLILAARTVIRRTA